jgi:hypothetical protein
MESIGQYDRFEGTRWIPASHAMSFGLSEKSSAAANLGSLAVLLVVCSNGVQDEPFWDRFPHKAASIQKS